jgi:hypothetical protein
LERPRRFVGEVQRQLQPIRLLRGDEAQPALGTVCSAGLDLESQGLGVETLCLILVVNIMAINPIRIVVLSRRCSACIRA